MNALRVISLFVLGAVTAAAQVAVAPAKRAEVLAQVEKLMSPREAAETPATPFHPEAFREVISSAGVAGPAVPAARPESARPAGPRAGRDLIAAVAEGLRPSGFFVVSGESTLVFGQKRVKAGDTLTITFEGAEYTVVITTVAPPNFTFRLGNEEFTRPIR